MRLRFRQPQLKTITTSLCGTKLSGTILNIYKMACKAKFRTYFVVAQGLGNDHKKCTQVQYHYAGIAQW